MIDYDHLTKGNFDDTVTVFGGEIKERSVCGYSPLAIILSMLLSVILLAAPLIISMQRFLEDIPLVGSCSAAISAACHPRRDEMGTGMSLKALQWGVVSFDANDNTKGHCAFSTLPVGKIKRGLWYAGQGDGERVVDGEVVELADDASTEKKSQ